MTSDVVANITDLISFSSANSYTIIASIGTVHNQSDTWSNPVVTYNRTANSFSIVSRSSVTNARLYWFAIGY